MPADPLPNHSQAVFTVIEAAQYYLRISRGKLYELIAAKEITPFKIGARTLFSLAELERFVLAAQRAA